MRLFIAIDVSDQIREALAQAEAHLKYASADVKWVAKENIHMTVKFLGEVPENKVEEVKASLDRVAKRHSAFDAKIKDLGAFPKIEYPRVIWAGLGEGEAGSKDIAKDVDEELSKMGFEKESRPFAAHLTIGRVRTPKNKDRLKDKMETCKLPALSCKIDGIILYQSTLTPQGSIYTKLHEAKLQN